jgi:Xaa-Pro aminopeptidase
VLAIRDQTITYLTGYTTMTWKMYSRPIVAVLAADGRLVVLAAETEVDSARLRIPSADVRSYVELRPVTEQMRLPDGRIQFAVHAAQVLGEIIEDVGPGLVAVDGLDAVWPPIGQLTHLVPELDGRTRDASELVWELRLRKSEWELGRMRRASEILDQAYTRLRDQLKLGMTEREISHQFSIAQLEAGAHEVGAHAVVAGPDRGLFGSPPTRSGTPRTCCTSTAPRSSTATGRTTAGLSPRGPSDPRSVPATRGRGPAWTRRSPNTRRSGRPVGLAR